MRVLLSSVFGPYGVDDAYGRKENRMELFHNQVTREQGVFSFRAHHHSFGLYLIAENIRAPTAVLDFPSESRFVEEIKKGYEYVGISFIVPNFLKAKRMAELVRQHAPWSEIVLGGHGTEIPDVEELIEHDHVCRGEGVRWFRRLVGEDPDAALLHPALPAAFSRGVFGAPFRNDAAVLMPGVGCPNGCRFCATSHFFGKKYTPYFETGEELFDVCSQIEVTLGLSEFFVMDENFLKLPDRCRELLRLMEERGKDWRFGIFSSADAIREVGVDFLVRLGVYFLWIGVESRHELFAKNRGIDLKALIREMRDRGIVVLASGILFVEGHDPETIWDDIKWVVEMEADFVQFMQLGPVPGTTLYKDYEERGIFRVDAPYEEWHGQHRIWYQHPHFTPEESERILREAFRYDLDTQGPSLLRMCDTVLRGLRSLSSRDGDPLLAKRREAHRRRAVQLRPALEVLRRHAHNDRVRSRTEAVIAEYEKEIGPPSLTQRALAHAGRLFAAVEAARLARRRTIRQPRTMLTTYRMQD